MLKISDTAWWILIISILAGVYIVTTILAWRHFNIEVWATKMPRHKRWLVMFFCFIPFVGPVLASAYVSSERYEMNFWAWLIFFILVLPSGIGLIVWAVLVDMRVKSSKEQIESGFKETSKNYLTHDDGFSVEMKLSQGIVYREEQRSLVIHFDEVVNPFHSSPLRIYPYYIEKWEPPFDADSIDEAKRLEIFKRINKALHYWGYDI